ncbi:hypothetical protein Tco_0818670 [Tanacetum coccineum]
MKPLNMKLPSIVAQKWNIQNWVSSYSFGKRTKSGTFSSYARITIPGLFSWFLFAYFSFLRLLRILLGSLDLRIADYGRLGHVECDKDQLWATKRRCGSFSVQGFKGGACKQVRGEVGESLRYLDACLYKSGGEETGVKTEVMRSVFRVELMNRWKLTNDVDVLISLDYKFLEHKSECFLASGSAVGEIMLYYSLFITLAMVVASPKFEARWQLILEDPHVERRIPPRQGASSVRYWLANVTLFSSDSATEKYRFSLLNTNDMWPTAPSVPLNSFHGSNLSFIERRFNTKVNELLDGSYSYVDVLDVDGTSWEAFYQNKKTGFGMIIKMKDGDNVMLMDDDEKERFMWYYETIRCHLTEPFPIFKDLSEEQRNIRDQNGGNTRDGVKIAGGVIGSGDEIEFSKSYKELISNDLGK